MLLARASTIAAGLLQWELAGVSDGDGAAGLASLRALALHQFDQLHTLQHLHIITIQTMTKAQMDSREQRSH